MRVLTTYDEVVAALADFVMRPEVHRELGEGLTFFDGDRFVVMDDGLRCIAFACLSKANKIRYVYVRPELRGQGLFGVLMDSVEQMADGRITATATDMALRLYLRRGFVVTKSWKKYHNITKPHEPVSRNSCR